jgi:hypothetical protein
MSTPSDISAELLELLKSFDDALSQANNSILAAAIPPDESLGDFGLLIAAVQNLLCDYHMFLVVRLSESQTFVINPKLIELLHERFNRVSVDPNVSELGGKLRIKIEQCSHRILELLLCLDRDLFQSIPSEPAHISEYLIRTLALERDLAWAQEFHVMPRLAALQSRAARGKM